MITHLVTNGLAVTPDGGVLSMSVERRHVATPSDRYAAGGHFACITVADEGHGIPPDRLETLFQPFFSPRIPPGAGSLGLSLCQDIVREHGGFIEVDSKAGRGTTITACFPESKRG